MLRLGLLCGAALAAGFVATLATGTNAQTPVPSERVPVVVELFTSEGCSDCPPADAVLSRLTSQPIPGVQIIALGEHVDYWDKQGWKDPFSSNAFTVRQVEYTRSLRIESPYTPQMIVNGRDEFVGSNYQSATDAIAKAARDRSRALHVSLVVDPISNGVLPVHVKSDAPSGAGLRADADVFIAVTEDGLESRVLRGENSGKNLHHVAVVRSLTRIGGIAAKATTWSAGGEVALEREWQSRAVRVVAFVQEHAGRAILGAATAPVS